MQGSILQFAQITVNRRLRGAELRRHLADSALHIEDACLMQVVHNAYFFVHRQAVGRQDTAGHIGDGSLHRVGEAADEIFDAQRDFLRCNFCTLCRILQVRVPIASLETVQKQCRNRALTLGQIKNDDFNHRLDGDLSDHKGKFDTRKEECPLV